MKTKYTVLLGTLALIFFNMYCTQEEKEGPAIFNDVTQMRAVQSGDTITFSDVPEETHILVVGIFNGNVITVNPDNVITNDDWFGGTRTGLEGCDKNTATKYYKYEPSINNFTLTTVNPTNGKIWAVWGYNKDWVVITSTESYTWN